MKTAFLTALAFFAVQLSAQPVASFIYQQDPPPDQCVNFTSTSTGNIGSYRWSFGDVQGSTSTIQNSYFCYSDTGCFNVELWVQDIMGNADSVTQTICIHEETFVFFPNAFSPNGDGINDVFCVYGTFIPENKFSMWIFDYWGGLVFYSEDPSKCWDGESGNSGELAQGGVYKVEMIWYDVHNTEHTYKGVIYNYPR